jgi:hypothetical protein
MKRRLFLVLAILLILMAATPVLAQYGRDQTRYTATAGRMEPM